MLKLTPTTNDALHGMEHSRAPQGATLTDSMGLEQQTLPEQNVNVPSNDVSAVPVLAPKKSFKVALVGTAPSSRMLAPFSDPEWKIWACSPGNMNALPRVDAWFEVHGNMLWPENKHYGENYLNWLRQQKFPVYMQNKSFISHAIQLPRDELVKEFGPYFFTSSFSWMMAFAMREGASDIALYGIDMASRDEYILQRPGAYYFFTEAERRGVKITAPYESDIMQPPMLYGFSEVTPIGRKICAREVEIRERINQARQQRDALSAQITYLEGALEDVDYWKTIWGGAQSHPLVSAPKEQE